ncbi:MAG: hypothetical protein KIT17_01815 [Rubrivivax sp.]|nr:hypothetical protein [Rubrivivax sp.]
MIIGVRAEGTLGQRLVHAEKQVRLFGEEQPVGAGVHTIGGLFAHADCDALLGWLRRQRHLPQRTFVVHGEAATACGLADRIADDFGWTTEAPVALGNVDVSHCPLRRGERAWLRAHWRSAAHRHCRRTAHSDRGARSAGARA